MITAGQRSAAKVAGLAYLVTFIVVVVANFAIHDRLNVAGDANATAHNIVTHQTLFRTGVALDLVYCLGSVALLTALYVILEPAGRGLAIFATLSKLVYVLAWMVMTISLFDALRLVKGADYLHVFEPDRLNALAKLSLSARFDRYYGGLLFFAVGGAVASWLWMKSRYIPRWLATGSLVAYAWCAFCAGAFIVFPSFQNVVNLWFFDTPMGLLEIFLSLWLLIKGVNDAAYQ
jgi:hypothetical protein